MRTVNWCEPHTLRSDRGGEWKGKRWSIKKINKTTPTIICSLEWETSHSLFSVLLAFAFASTFAIRISFMCFFFVVRSSSSSHFVIGFILYIAIIYTHNWSPRFQIERKSKQWKQRRFCGDFLCDWECVWKCFLFFQIHSFQLHRSIAYYRLKAYLNSFGCCYCWCCKCCSWFKCEKCVTLCVCVRGGMIFIKFILVSNEILLNEHAFYTFLSKSKFHS